MYVDALMQALGESATGAGTTRIKTANIEVLGFLCLLKITVSTRCGGLRP
jgi:hypothetical protein